MQVHAFTPRQCANHPKALALAPVSTPLNSLQRDSVDIAFGKKQERPLWQKMVGTLLGFTVIAGLASGCSSPPPSDSGSQSTPTTCTDPPCPAPGYDSYKREQNGDQGGTRRNPDQNPPGQ